MLNQMVLVLPTGMLVIERYKYRFEGSQPVIFCMLPTPKKVNLVFSFTYVNTVEIEIEDIEGM